MEQLIQWELSLLHSIQEFATPLWDTLWTSVTMLGESGIFWIVLSLVLMIPKKTRRAGFSMGLALLIGLILCNGVMKNVFARPRPYHLDPTLAHRLAWGEMSTDFSFPSGHTTASFEGAVALILRHKKWGTVALVAAFLIAISRICLIVHYPTDVVFGAVFGAAYAFLASWVVDTLWRLYDKKQEEKKQKQA
ncbi:MAG: phosphatase PAP2 family protein [Clostridia bacterium]|nr:phosphatase PAP2 family protein [Clostridia bacterium]